MPGGNVDSDQTDPEYIAGGIRVNGAPVYYLLATFRQALYQRWVQRYRI